MGGPWSGRWWSHSLNVARVLFSSLLPRYLRLQDSCHWRRDCRQLRWKCYRLQRRQRVPGYWNRMDHGCHLLGVPGPDLRCPRRKPGILCDHLLLGSSLCNPHPSGQKTPSRRRRAWRTQVLQDSFIFHLRLLLVLLRHDLCSGDVRRHRAWLLKSSHTNTRKQYMSLRTRHSPCDRCEVDPKSSSTVGWNSVLDIETWNKTQFALVLRLLTSNVGVRGAFAPWCRWPLDLHLSPTNPIQVKSSQSGYAIDGGRMRTQAATNCCRNVQFVVDIPLLFLAI